jgi:hypothetical protein
VPDALFGTMRVIETLEALATAKGVTVLYVLTYSTPRFRQYLRNGYRFDQALIAFLESKQVPYVDMLLTHAADFARYKDSAEEYCSWHFDDGRGHYNPADTGFIPAYRV